MIQRRDPVESESQQQESHDTDELFQCRNPMQHDVMQIVWQQADYEQHDNAKQEDTGESIETEYLGPASLQQ